MDRLRTYFKRFAVKDAPKAKELLNLCMETIRKLSSQYPSSSTEADKTNDYLMNRHQCNFIVGRLNTDTQVNLQMIQLSPLLDEKTTPVLEELHQVLLNVETVIDASRITSSQWPRAAIEQSDMKETFASLLYGVQWHVSVLLSILVDNSQESSITLEPALCEGQLSMGDELSLLTAMKDDEESLKDRLRSVKLDDPSEKRLANELLKLKMRCEEEDHLNTSSVADDSTGLSSPSDILYLDPEDLHLDGTPIGRGVSAVVKKTNLVGGEYAIKIFDMYRTEEFEKEMIALQRLGRHPHIVRLLCYSKEDAECFLIMEEMDKDLYTVFKNYRKKNKRPRKHPLSDVQAVALMLQIGEGVKYIHSKGMAHRDLKSGNILVNFADPSSTKFISSVKIADFGLTKTKTATHTYSNQTYDRGTNKWMAPEVIRGDDPEKYSRFNPRKADVFSFAIICFEVLTGEDPYYDVDLSILEIKEQVKAGTLRPNLPNYCPQRLAALIRRCWHPISQERPLFPEICRELRYITGLLLKGDRKMLEVHDSRPLRALEGAQLQGPWGGDGGGNFLDMSTSINRMKLRYSQSPGLIGSMEVDYNLVGTNFVRRYCDDYIGDQYAEIKFEPFEFITHISGFVSHRDLRVQGTDKLFPFQVVVSLTIHTNIKSCGPYGNEDGEPFASSIGRVIGFHGGSGALLDRLGVVVILGDTN